MSYTKTNWENGAVPAINADNLNHMEQGIYDAHEGVADCYTKAESNGKYRTISDSYSKSGDFKIITLSKSLGMRGEGEYTDSLASYIDSADKYAVISAAMYADMAPTSAAPLGQRWIYSMINPVHDASHDGLLSNAKYWPQVNLYNSNGTPYVNYNLYNPTNYSATVRLRLVLLKIA